MNSQDKFRRETLDAFTEFYYEKNNKDSDATYEEIQNLQISQIECLYNGLIIFLASPGIFIGKRGENIERLTNYMMRKLDLKNIIFKLLKKIV